MIGGFKFNLFGGSKSRKLSRKKRGGKIVLDNENNNNKNKQKGGKIVLEKQNGGHSSCGAHKKIQNGGSGRGGQIRSEKPLHPRRSARSTERFNYKHYGTTGVKKPTNSLNRKSSSKKSSSKKSSKKSSKSSNSSGNHSLKKSKSKGKSFAARAAFLNPGNPILKIN